MASIGFVVNEPAPTANDTAMKATLEGAGHTVTLIGESATPPAAGTHDVIIISESGATTTVAPYDTYADPVMVWETAWNSLRLATVGATTAGSTTQVDLTGHESTTGLPDPLTYLASASSMYGVGTANLASGVTVVGRHPTTTTHAFAVVADAGATLTSGTAPARRAAMGLIDSRVGNLTADGNDLVLAMVDWLLGAGATPPNSGSASGGYAFSGTATGSAPRGGAASGSYSFSGTAAGQTDHQGSASGSYDFSGSATGGTPADGTPEGTASGGYDFAGSAVGAIDHRGSVAGGYQLAGLAAGEHPMYEFTPPSYRKVIQPQRGRGPRFSIDQGISIVRKDGVLRLTRAPSPTQLREAGEEGTDWFIGGHLYRVSAETLAELTTGGFV